MTTLTAVLFVSSDRTVILQFDMKETVVVDESSPSHRQKSSPVKALLKERELWFCQFRRTEPDTMHAKAQQKKSPVAVGDKPQTTRLWDRLIEKYLVYIYEAPSHLLPA